MIYSIFRLSYKQGNFELSALLNLKMKSEILKYFIWKHLDNHGN